ncbi:unnamed protein product [Adineta ricciae]|uniref:G-protein coupled receptors family 1 profile domain-containing protein n=1 Tax=Adineta ricciae TaxID=249248 RepID=A0A815WF31_ADIRI|nr:unnamed protein product [Adineta ricciae]
MVMESVRFWILLIFEIPSLICCLLLLYYLCFEKSFRTNLNHHVFLLILINVLLIELIDVPNYLTFLRLNFVWPQLSINCYLWWFITYGNYSSIGILMGWASIEKHIFIFHSQLLNTKKKRILYHYLPLLMIMFYTSIFYIICIFFASCEPVFDYNSSWCYTPCYTRIENLSRYDILMNTILPIFIIISSDVFLFIRVIKQRQSLHQEIQWYKYKRMIIQISLCSFLFLAFQIPTMCYNFAQTFGLKYEISDEIVTSLYCSAYFMVLLMPFLCLISSKDIWLKIKSKYIRNIIIPQITIR